MKKLVSLMALVCAIVVGVSATFAQGTIKVYMAIGSYEDPTFLGNMVQGIMGNPTSTVTFIQPGARLDLSSLVSYNENSGQFLAVGFSVTNATTFTLDQMVRNVWGYTGSLSGGTFSPLLIGIDRNSGTTYISGQPADTTPINEAYAVADIFTLMARNQLDVPRAVKAFGTLYGTPVYTAQYSLGSISGQSSVVLVPESSTWIIQYPIYTNGQFRIDIAGVTNGNYIVQANTNLNTSNWVSLVTNPAPFTFTNTVSTNEAQKYFRAIYSP